MERASTKAPGRSRWNANPQQLQTLESMFEQGSGNTPNKARIKEIALELGQFGPISETNVYNWFQNRKARAKRKLQHQVGRRRRLTRSTPEKNAPKVSRKERAVKASEFDTEEDEEASVISPRVKRLKTERDVHELQQLVANEQLVPNCNEPNPPPDQLGAGSSAGVEEIEGVLEDHLRSHHHHHVDFATLATDPQLPNVDHITADILFSDHHFHEPGTMESPNGQLISEDVEAWDVRNSFGESSRLPYHASNDDALHFPSGLTGEKLISLAGGPVPSMDESPKVVTECRGLETHELGGIHIHHAAGSGSEMLSFTGKCETHRESTMSRPLRLTASELHVTTFFKSETSTNMLTTLV